MEIKEIRKQLKRDERMRELSSIPIELQATQLRRSRRARLITAYDKWLWDVTSLSVREYSDYD